MKVFGVLILAVSLTACGPSAKNEGLGAGVVYGDDSRQDPDPNITDERIKAALQASGAIIRSALLQRVNSNIWKVSGTPLARQRNLCPDVRFANQLSASFCSGTLIGPNKFLTAGHCVESGCDDFKIVFGWTHASGSQVKSADIYSCKSILKLHISDDVTAPDLAVIELDRPVQNRKPVELTFETFTPSEDVLLVGYPSGIPQKLSTAKVRFPPGTGNYAVVASDTFSGDSGCPVFSTDGKVKGILIGGEDDYVYNEKRGCYVVNNCAEDECRGEDVLQLKPEYLE